MKVWRIWSNSLVPRALLGCVVVGALPVLPFVVNDYLDHRACVVPASTLPVGSTIVPESLLRRHGIRNRDLPERSVRRPEDIAGRRAVKVLDGGVCISFDDVDVARVRLTVRAAQVVGEILPIGSRIDLVASPTGDQDQEKGVVVKDAILIALSVDTVTFAVTDAERESLAALIGRSDMVMVPAGEVGAP